MPRTVAAHLFCSVNGVVESPDRFQLDSFGREEGEAMGAALAGVSDVVMGRRLFQEWSGYWAAAGADDPFAAFINPVRKHVLSRTLSGDVGWNGTVVEGDPAERVRALAADGTDDDRGSIAVVGGVETVRYLFLAGVVDALTLTVHPAVTGEGRRLFDDSVPLTRLRLLEGRTTPAGNAMLTYALRSGDA